MQHGIYDPVLVGTSFLVASVASFTALEVTRRVATLSGLARTVWLAAGSVLLGTGIWTMHFVGMLAYRLEVSVAYDVPLTVYSFFIGVAASGLAISVASRGSGKATELGLAAIVLGLGVTAMHYTVTSAMLTPVHVHYDLGIVAASILTGIVVAFAALRIAVWITGFGATRPWRFQAAAAVVLGAALCGVHYTGTAGATFVIDGTTARIADYGVNASQMAGLMTAALLLLLSSTLLILRFDFKLAAKEHDERILQAMVEERTRELEDQANELREINWRIEKEAEERLHAQAEAAHFGKLLNESAHEIYTFDAETLRFSNVNESAIDNLGYSWDELADMTPLDLKPEFDLETFETLIEPLRAGAEPNLWFETVHRRSDGTHYPVVVSLQLTEVNGRRSFVAMLRDITERRKTEALVKASQARYQAAIELMPDAHVITDDQGRIQTFNNAAEDIFGYCRDEIIGENVRVLMPGPHEGSQDPFAGRFGESVRGDATGARRYKGLWACRKDQSEFPIGLLVQRFTTDEGLFFSGIITDISKLQEVESRNRLLSAVVEQATDQIILLNADQTFEYVNPQVERDMGWTLDELRGKSSVDPDSRRPFAHSYQEMYAALHTDGIWKGQFRSETSDGTTVDLDVTASVLRNDEHALTHYMVIGRNITERRKLEDRLRRSQKLESIGQLAAGIAHEINTPAQYVGDNNRFLKESFDDIGTLLAGIGEMLHEDGDAIAKTELSKLLEDADAEYLQEEVPRAIDQSLDGISRISKIVRAMKEFSHPAEEKTPTDLNRAIESTITVASNEWKYIADVRKDLDSRLGPVPCLPGELNQVVLNMIVNAAHAIGDAREQNGNQRGTISVSTKRLKDWAEIRIADTGTGMPEKVRQRIFDPFFTTKEVGKGTGQGLSIAHAIIVEKHAGTLDVESEVGKGTCFTIRIPLRDPEKAAAKARPGQENAA